MKYYLIISEFDKTRNFETFNKLKTTKFLVNDIDEADIFVVVGGDGALLKAVQSFKKYNKPFFGFNGGSIGYYMNHCSVDNFLFHLKNHVVFDTFTLPFLNFKVTYDNKYSIKGNFMADVWVERNTPNALKYEISINNQIMSDSVIGDGILFSTPLGSTGYTKNLGGKIVSVDTPIIQMVPMACSINKSRLTSLILNKDSVIDINFIHTDFRKNSLCFDGFIIPNKQNQSVSNLKISNSSRSFTLLFLSVEDFYRRSFQWHFSG